MTTPHVVNIYPHFYRNPYICHHLASKEKWTVSDKNKRPIDIRHLFDTGSVRGASFTYSDGTPRPNPLVNLTTLITQLPDAANHAFMLNAYDDQCVIIDIEPDCDPILRDELLELMPASLYTELSMSGKGYHLVMPAPQALLDNYLIAQTKTALKSGKDFEILINHWVTFTRKAITYTGTTTYDEALTKWQQLWDTHASQATTTTTARIQSHATTEYILDEDVDPKQYHVDQTIIHNITEAFADYLAASPHVKTLADFDHDHSRFEFSRFMVITRLSYKELFNDHLTRHSFPYITSHDINLTQLTRIVYHVARDVLDYRPKHDEVRSGLPYLLYVAINAVESFDTQTEFQHLYDIQQELFLQQAYRDAVALENFYNYDENAGDMYSTMPDDYPED